MKNHKILHELGCLACVIASFMSQALQECRWHRNPLDGCRERHENDKESRKRPRKRKFREFRVAKAMRIQIHSTRYFHSEMVRSTLLDCCDVVFLAIMEKTRSGHPNGNIYCNRPFCDFRKCFDLYLKIRLYFSTEQVCARF